MQTQLILSELKLPPNTVTNRYMYFELCFLGFFFLMHHMLIILPVSLQHLIWHFSCFWLVNLHQRRDRAKLLMKMYPQVSFQRKRAELAYETDPPFRFPFKTFTLSSEPH